MQENSIPLNANVVIIDDLIATGTYFTLSQRYENDGLLL